MLDELRDLYQEVILDHGRNPRNYRHPPAPTCQAHGHNPMCGDTIVVYLTLDDHNRIVDAAFEGRGCAISTASASLMTEIVVGKSVDEVEHLFTAFHDMCTRDDFVIEDAANGDGEALERLQVLAGVREFPVRVKCATLAWHTMKAAIAGEAEISTE